MSVLVRPISVNHPGTQWYGPNFHTTVYLHDVIPVGAYHFIGSRVCLCGPQVSAVRRGRVSRRSSHGVLVFVSLFVKATVLILG